MSQLDRDKFDAAFAKQSAESGLDEGDKAEALWAILEPALEGKGLYEEEHREHLRETTHEIRSWRNARRFATTFAVLIVMIMLYAIDRVLEGKSKLSFTTMGGDGVKIAFVTATFGIVFGLTALMLRGSFGPSRKEDGPMLPEGAKTLIEAVQALFGRG
jgi:hypothetical protein